MSRTSLIIQFYFAVHLNLLCNFWTFISNDYSGELTPASVKKKVGQKH